MQQKLQRWTLILLFSLVFWFGGIDRAEAIALSSPAHTRHILERLSFGTTSEQRRQVNNVGIEAYIQSQLNPQLVTESPILIDYLKQLDSIDRQPIELQQQEIALRQQRDTAESSAEKQQIAKKEQIYGIK